MNADIEKIVIFIPIIAIVLGCSIPLLAIFLHYRKRKEMFTLYHQERMAAIEKGIELPPLPEAFFTEDGQPPEPLSPHRNLLTGLILLFIGFALLIAFQAGYREHLTIFGLVPAGIGLAYLIYYFVVGRKEATAMEAAEKAKSAETSHPRVV
jgi:hypothetical protein